MLEEGGVRASRLEAEYSAQTRANVREPGVKNRNSGFVGFLSDEY